MVILLRDPTVLPCDAWCYAAGVRRSATYSSYVVRDESGLTDK